MNVNACKTLLRFLSLVFVLTCVSGIAENSGDAVALQSSVSYQPHLPGKVHGRLDVFLASWFPQIPSKLFLNKSTGGHWLRVRVIGKTINRMGIGSKVRVYRAGQVGQAEALLGYNEIGTGFGFCSGQEAVAHFGLGNAKKCDVEATLPHGRGKINKLGVRADQLLLVHER